MSQTVKIEKFTVNFDDPKHPLNKKFHIDIAWFPTGYYIHNEGIDQINKAMQYLGEHKLIQFNTETKELTIGEPDKRFTLGQARDNAELTELLRLSGENLSKIAYCYVTLKNKK